MIEFMGEVQKIQNKAVFDGLNEALDYFRPYGVKGKPLVWKVTTRINEQKYVDVNNVNDVLNQAKNRVLKWNKSQCGLCDDDQELANLREEKMTNMLNQDTRENDDRWLEFDEEKTEVMLEINELVFDFLLNECVQELVV